MHYIETNYEVSSSTSIKSTYIGSPMAGSTQAAIKPHVSRKALADVVRKLVAGIDVVMHEAVD